MEELFREIEKYVMFKNFSKAKELAQKIEPESMRHNVLGILFYQEGELDKALEHFQSALRLDPVNDDVLFNLSKVLFEKKKFFESWRYLTRIKNKTWEVYDLLGDTQLVQDNFPMALHYYSKAAQLSDLPQMKEKFERAKAKFKRSEKIAIFCLPGLDNFIKDIAQVLSNVFEVKLVVTTDGNQIVQAYKWADIVWLEWANELAVEVTNKLEKKGKKIVCRLHSYEALTDAFLSRIKWDKIDNVILVAEHMKDAIKMYHPNVYRDIENKIEVVHNGLNLDKFKYKPRTKGYNIAVVAHVNHKKDPTMWLQIIGYLRKIDPRYNLSIAGDFQDYRYHFYFNHFIKDAGLQDNVKLLGFVKNIDEFLEDKNYILSTSVHESFGYNIAEAMAMGIKPIVHNFYGAKDLWLKDTLFNFIDEIPNVIMSDYRSEEYRMFVEDLYSLEKQVLNVFRVLVQDRASNSVPLANQQAFEVSIRNYEDELETKLSQRKAPVSEIQTELLVNNTIPLMINLLEEFVGKGIPYQKTLYYAFLKDVYEKGYYTIPPEQIISKFLKLFDAIRQTGRILKPVVAFHNDGNLAALDPVVRQPVKIPKDVSFLVASGRHRVAVAKFLGMRTVPTYAILNRFASERGIQQILITYWQPYLQRMLPTYTKQIQETYVGAFDGSYQDTVDPAKKELITRFVLDLRPKSVVDIGCNRGEFSYHLAKHGIEVLGVDISPREKLNLPPDYNFIQLDVVKEDLPRKADVILFLSVYHHIFYNYGKDKADEVFYKLFRNCRFLVFDSGHPEEVGLYRQGWISEMRKYFKTEKELLDHFGLNYSILGSWCTPQGVRRTVVVFENRNFK
jgi:glycosyltransferase involved in cell wall biosynthesis